MNPVTTNALKEILERLEQNELDGILSESVFTAEDIDALHTVTDDEIVDCVYEYGEAIGEPEHIKALAAAFIVREANEFRTGKDLYESLLARAASAAFLLPVIAGAGKAALDSAESAHKKSKESKRTPAFAVTQERSASSKTRSLDLSKLAKKGFAKARKFAAKALAGTSKGVSRAGKSLSRALSGLSKKIQARPTKAKVPRRKLRPGEKMVFGKIRKVQRKPGMKATR